MQDPYIRVLTVYLLAQSVFEQIATRKIYDGKIIQ